MRGSRLGGDLRRILALAARPDVLAGEQGGHELGAALLHHAQRLVVEERAVLDRVDAGADRDLGAFGAVGVGRGLLAQPVRLVDDARSSRPG